MSFLENAKNKSKDYIYQLERKKFLYSAITEIGEVILKDDCIYCIVKQDLLDKYRKKNINDIRLYGMNTRNKQKKEQVKLFDLDKKVHYIFDGIKLDYSISLESYFCDVTFKNCVFNYSNILIIDADKITFENNSYISNGIFHNFSSLRTVCLSKIKELNFINENFINEKVLDESVIKNKNHFGIDVNADKVNIKNSILSIENDQVNIRAKETTILDSNITAPEIYLDSDKITYDNSLISAENGVIIENKNEDFNIEENLENISSTFISYNGKVVKDIDDLKKGQEKLTKTLKVIADTCASNMLVGNTINKK